MGRDHVQALDNVLEYHEHPEAFLAKLQRQLNAPDLSSEAAVAFRDYTDLGEAASPKPEALDWIDTLRATLGPAGYDDPGGQVGPAGVAAAVARHEGPRKAALAHAMERWRTSQDRAWLVAGLSLADLTDPATAVLVRAAEQIRPGEPAWITVQHHLIRLTLGRKTPSQSRGQLDAVLGRDLSVSDRNVFSAQRAQTASSLQDFVRFAIRRRLCVGADRVDWSNRQPPACVRGRWDNNDVQPSGVYDGVGDKGSSGLGEDARAIVDRASLDIRQSLAHDRQLPAKLRLDIALTNYGRAVQLQDDAAIDASARELVGLLPLMAEQFCAVMRSRPGPDKRFA